ncbi:hypothetical protein COP1_018960 [Malus domestica]|uniref:uncharacterized protein n=1 Tax=Malus domestica TaxID=3750 RepID=UPI003975B429
MIEIQLNSNKSMHKFSYYLPDPDVQTTASRRENKLQPTLNIGSDATITGDIQSTVILKSQCHDKYYYYLNMTAISVNGKHLRIDPRIFVTTSSGTERFIIKPGTAITLLAKEAFRSFKSSVSKEVMKRYLELIPMKNSKSGFDLRYSTRGAICNVSEMSFPKVQFYFHSDDGDGRPPNIVLQKLFITVHTQDEDCACLSHRKWAWGQVY